MSKGCEGEGVGKGGGRLWPCLYVGLLSILLDYVTVYYFCLISLSPFLLRLMPCKATL